ncbi:hypothetical protein CMZ84_14420 [Lysobacteraceae bacterium NML93-0399]|nr:hypothetical protein CMZ84_14420 [Xanthomonadaceae bacterium NML93-0399]
MVDTGARPRRGGHRIVHGGDLRNASELDEDVLAKLDALVPFAPLHQPVALAFARAARLRWPQARQGVAFDTDFHVTLAPWSQRLPIPEAWDALGVRRYGFHGLAFASALRVVASQDAGILRSRAVFAHLGGVVAASAPSRTVGAATPPWRSLRWGESRALPAPGISIPVRCCTCSGTNGWTRKRLKMVCPALQVLPASPGTAICACCLPILARRPSLPWTSSQSGSRSPSRPWPRESADSTMSSFPAASATARRVCGRGSSRAWAGLAWRWHLTTTMLGPRGSMPRAGRPSGTSRSMRNASWPNQHWPGCSPRHTARAAPARITRRSVAS